MTYETILGEIRSLLSTTEPEPKQVQKAWESMRALMSESPERFENEVVPYLFSSGFLGADLPDVTFCDPGSFKLAYPQLAERVWWGEDTEEEEDEEEDHYWESPVMEAWSAVCYGVRLPVQVAALALHSMLAQGLDTSDVCFMVPDKEQESLRGQIVCGVRAEKVLALNEPLDKKLQRLESMFESLFGGMAPDQTHPLSFFADMDSNDGWGGCGEASVVFGPVNWLAYGGEDGRPGEYPHGEFMWLNPERQGATLDTIRLYGESDEDDQHGDSAPIYECVRLLTIERNGWVSEEEGIQVFSLTPEMEKKAIARLAKAGIDDHKYAYSLQIHQWHNPG